MGRSLKIELSADARAELEQAYRTGDSHAYRQRCRMVLLKADGLLTKEICKIVGIKSQTQVNRWIHRYKTQYSTDGLSVLHNEPGQGRKPILSVEVDAEAVRAAVSAERQRLKQAQQELQNQTGKTFHVVTLRRFLKNLTADTDASVGG